MQNDEVLIRDLTKTWMEATRAGDVDRVLALMSADAVFLVPGQPLMTKADFAQQARRQASAPTMTIDSSSDIEEIIVAGRWAFMRTRLTVVVTPAPGAPAITRAGRTLTILKKEGERWLLARDANLLVAGPSAPG